MIVFNMLMLRLEGNTAVAAYGVIANLILVVIAIFTGIGQGTSHLSVMPMDAANGSMHYNTDATDFF